MSAENELINLGQCRLTMKSVYLMYQAAILF